MDKSKANIYIQLFQEGNLSEEKELELKEWIQQSAENLAFFRMQTEKKAIESLNTTSGEVEEQLYRLSDKLNVCKVKTPLRKTWLRVASFAATFLIGALLTTFLWQFVNPLSFNAPMQTVYTPLGVKSKFKLADGTQVWLNSGSTLMFAESFGKKRNVRLEGEAYLEVTKSNRPFVVETPYGNVEVKGTSFNVKAYNNEAFVTTLTEGKVEVRDEENKVLLNPGEQAIQNDGILYVKNVNPYRFTSWKDGVLILKQDSLPSVMKKLERWYNVKITMDNDLRLNSIRISSSIEGEPLVEVMELLALTCPINYSYNKENKTIHIKYKKNSLCNTK